MWRANCPKKWCEDFCYRFRYLCWTRPIPDIMDRSGMFALCILDRPKYFGYSRVLLYLFRPWLVPKLYGLTKTHTSGIPKSGIHRICDYRCHFHSLLFFKIQLLHIDIVAFGLHDVIHEARRSGNSFMSRMCKSFVKYIKHICILMEETFILL